MSTKSIRKQSPIRTPLCCPQRWLNLCSEDAASQVPLENLHLCSSHHPPIYNNYVVQRIEAYRGLWGCGGTSAPYCSPGSEPLVTPPQPRESNHASEEGEAGPDGAGAGGGKGKLWDTAELLPTEKPFLQRVMHRKGSSGLFPRSASPFHDPFKLSLYRYSLF